MTNTYDPSGCACRVHISETAAPTTSLELGSAELEDWTAARGVAIKGETVTLAEAYRLRAEVDAEVLAFVAERNARDAEDEAAAQARAAHADTNGVCPYAAMPRDHSRRTDLDRRAWLAARNARAASR